LELKARLKQESGTRQIVCVNPLQLHNISLIKGLSQGKLLGGQERGLEVSQTTKIYMNLLNIFSGGITKEERSDSLVPFYEFDLRTVQNTVPFLEKLKEILEKRKFNEFNMGKDCFRQDQIDQVEEFIADLRLVSLQRFSAYNLPFSINGVDLFIGNSTGLEVVLFLNSGDSRIWSLEQQIAILNATLRLEKIQEAHFQWIPALDQSLYLSFLQIQSLRKLVLKITNNAVSLY